MCLTYVTREVKKPTNKTMNVWKVFSVSKTGGLYPDCQNSGKAYTKGKWIPKKGKHIFYCLGSKQYRAGFHGFVLKRDAVEWAVSGQKIVKVFFRKVHTYGTQRWKKGLNANILVADDMYIPK